MTSRPEGITHPSIDELLASTDSKYSLVIYAARRARQITGYYSQVGEYALEYVGPLVDAHPHEKPLSIALREIHAGLLVAEAEDPAEVAARAQAEAAAAAAAEQAAIEAATVDPSAMVEGELEAEVVEFPGEPQS
ncbi:MAG: DNA-directed RNA polymerase subunit omega [Actinobacteria bacterium]|nr:DNA-directed RNA polymerase subunit omega [Actinomycetota bacterium]